MQDFYPTLPVFFFSFWLLSFLHLSLFFTQLFLVLRGQLRLNSPVSPLWLWIMYTATETGKDRKYHDWSLPPWMLAGPPSGRPCEFAAHCVWCLDVAWSYRVMRDSAHNSHASWRVARCFWFGNFMKVLTTAERELETSYSWNGDVPSFYTAVFECSCQSKHGSYIWVWQSDFCNIITSYP